MLVYYVETKFEPIEQSWTSERTDNFATLFRFLNYFPSLSILTLKTYTGKMFRNWLLKYYPLMTLAL